MKVHRCLGPGLLESVYEECLCWELQNHGFDLQRQVRFPLIYEGLRLPAAYCADIVVERSVVLEIKSVEIILPVHKAQLLTYLRLSGCRIGLLMNFNQALLKDGLHRFVL
jgi:GxxExxY protein